jgi:hypothetical protein
MLPFGLADLPAARRSRPSRRHQSRTTLTRLLFRFFWVEGRMAYTQQERAHKTEPGVVVVGGGELGLGLGRTK